MDPTLTIAGLAGLLALTWKLVDFAKLVANLPASRSPVVTQVLVFAVAVGAVFLYGASELGGFAIPGTDLLLEDVGAWTKLIVGLMIGAGASTLYDAKQAVDGSDSAAKPPLLRQSPPR